MGSSFRVQRSVHVFGSGGVGPSTVTLGTPADATRAFPRLSSNLRSGAGRDVASTTSLLNRDLSANIADWDGAGFTLERATGAELQDHRYYFETIEDVLPSDLRSAHGFTLRSLNRFRLPAATLSATTAAITGIVDPLQCVVWPIAIRAADNDQSWADACITGYLDTATNEVVLQRGQGVDSATFNWAAIEFGTAWTVRRVTLSTSSRGTDVPITGCGAEPWSEKFYVVSWRTPNGADSIADVPLFRASASDPDVLLYSQPVAGTAGTYNCSVYVVHHPLLWVQHWSNVDMPAYGGLLPMETDTLIEIPIPVSDWENGVSILASSDHDASNLGYPRMHIGHTLEPGGTHVRFRRGRTTDRTSNWAAQCVRWPLIPQGHTREFVGHATHSRQVG